MRRLAQRAAAIAWPSFLAAGMLEILVFAFVDPAALHGLGGSELRLSDNAFYSYAFFAFWAITTVGCLLTLVLTCGAEELNGTAPFGAKSHPQ
jgi:hypothetical protein